MSQIDNTKTPLFQIYIHNFCLYLIIAYSRTNNILKFQANLYIIVGLLTIQLTFLPQKKFVPVCLHLCSSLKVNSFSLKVMFHRETSEDKDEEVFGVWRQQRRVSIAKSSDDGSKTKAHAQISSDRMNRRRSTFKGVANSVHSLLGIRRMSKARVSVSNTEDMKPKVRYENTYKLGPDSGKVASSNKIETAVKSILEQFLGNEKYSPDTCSSLACSLSIMIKNAVKDMDLPRYKIITNVIISQHGAQSMQTASRCLWDTSTDNFSHVTYNNASLCAVVTVHCVYFE